MKRLRSIVLVLVLLCVFAIPFFAFTGCEQAEETDDFIIYNLEDYIDEAVLDEFEEWYFEQYGKRIKVSYNTYDTNETMLTKVVNNDAIYERTSKFGDDFADYFVPYMYGTLGILYNADVIEENDIDVEEAGWGLMWNTMDCEDLRGKILMKDSIRDTFAAAACYLKEQDLLPDAYADYSLEDLINCTDEELVDAVRAVLMEQKSELKGYEVDFGKDDLINLHAYVDLAWSGDAMYAIEEAELYDVNLDYFVPEVGANMWFDGWFIPTCSKQVEVANAFIEFMCLPTVAAANMIEVGYTSAIDQEVLIDDEDVIAMLEDAEYDVEEYFAWDVRYPDVHNPNYGMMADYGDARTRMTIMWEEVKAAEPEGVMPIWQLSLIILAAIIVFLGLVALGAFLLQRFLRSRRYTD